jgi:hypothetical protein
MRRFEALDAAWKVEVPGQRLKALRRAAPSVREALLGSGPVAALRCCPLLSLPFPTPYAFSGAALSPAPYVQLTGRMVVVQFNDWDGQPRTLLFNPSDVERGGSTPFYANLAQRYGAFVAGRLLGQARATVLSRLSELGLGVQRVDYLAYDHLHLQDVRGWLGAEGIPGVFPGAQLLVDRLEWASTRELHPMQYVWYAPDGTRGVDERRVVQLEGDAWLGPGVALLRTPGHTLGHRSLSVVTDGGLFVFSGNGVATECYAPMQSAIPGLRSWAERMGCEVVPNGNTLESSLDQYASMVLEKLLAGPSAVDPLYPNVLPSAELTASLLCPGLSPTFTLVPPSQGAIRP